MKVINRGFITSRKQLPEIELPDNAVGFKAPEVKFDVKIPTFVFVFISAILIWIIFSIASVFRGEIEINLMNYGSLIGLITGLLCIPLQGILRGRYAGGDAVINLFFSWGVLYTICYDPIPKRNFIIMGVVPSIIIGWIPLLISAFIPMPDILLNFLFVWGFISVVFSSRYYTSSYCAFTQMPNGSLAIMSGAEYYWFIP